eukprot:750950-Hanusia_phi.AAC.2
MKRQRDRRRARETWGRGRKARSGELGRWKRHRRTLEDDKRDGSEAGHVKDMSDKGCEIRVLAQNSASCPLDAAREGGRDVSEQRFLIPASSRAAHSGLSTTTRSWSLYRIRGGLLRADKTEEEEVKRPARASVTERLEEAKDNSDQLESRQVRPDSSNIAHLFGR